MRPPKNRRTYLRAETRIDPIEDPFDEIVLQSMSNNRLGTKDELVAVRQRVKFACITPSLDVLSTTERFFEFMNSHKWRILKSESYEPDGFLSKLNCSNCNLNFDLALTNILESARNARRSDIKRIVNSKKQQQQDNDERDTLQQRELGGGLLESNDALWGMYLDKESQGSIGRRGS